MLYKSNKEWRKALREQYGNKFRIDRPKKNFLVAVLNNKELGYWNGKEGVLYEEQK